MINLERLEKHLFHPIYPVLLYLFMAITTLHALVPALLSIHIESLTLIWALFTSSLYFLLHERSQINYKNPVILSCLTGFLFIISPIISSLVNQDSLKILADEEYLTLFKMTLFVPCLFLQMKDKKQKETIINSVVLFYVFFALYFLYRFLILHEVRDFDQRPRLLIRHGDANFLCTFFSMMIPISLMQAWRYAQKKNETFKTLFFLAAAALIFICTFLTESRMGLIATLAGLVYLLSRPVISLSKAKWIAFSFLVFLVLAFNGERLLSRFSEIQDKSNSDRYLTWKNGAQLFFENPFFGKGAHNAKNFFYQNTGYPHFQSEFNPLEVHNSFLKIAAELGLCGLALFSFLYFWPWKKTLELKSAERYFLLSSMLILTLSLMTIGIIYKDLFILHLFMVAALAIFYRPEFKES